MRPGRALWTYQYSAISLQRSALRVGRKTRCGKALVVDRSGIEAAREVERMRARVGDVRGRNGVMARVGGCRAGMFFTMSTCLPATSSRESMAPGMGFEPSPDNPSSSVDSVGGNLMLTLRDEHGTRQLCYVSSRLRCREGRCRISAQSRTPPTS